MSYNLLMVLAVMGALMSMQALFAAEPPLYLDENQPMEARVEDLLRLLTLEEKIGFVHGNSKFSSGGVERLDVPKLWLSDGPHGVREEIGPDSWNAAGWTDDFATALPVSMALASTWNADRARDYGRVIGQEALRRDKHIMLGPSVNIMRTPLCGRNFEYMGEDPWLASRVATAYIQALQAEDVAGCVKHFAANNQEEQRGTINVEMEERTLREIYLPAFAAAVREGGVWSVMGAYNKFRGEHCCHNDYLLNQVLKGEWGFQGIVVSDWAGVHDTREAVFNGMDLEMGTDRPYDEYYLANPFQNGIERGDYPLALLDDKVRRNLRVLLATKALGGRKPGAINTQEHQAVARQVAEEGIVLLKNEGGLLPLDPTQLQTLAVIGDNAVTKFASGGGAAGIKAFYEITPLEGITTRAGRQVNVTFSQGYRHPVRNPWGPPDAAGVRASSTATVATPEEVESMTQRALEAARAADVVVFVAGLSHQRNFDAEGSDRFDLKLPAHQDELIQRLAQENPRIVVVLVSGAPVEMDPWLPNVPAVLQAWYGGSEGGTALARVLFGDINPSGKLPCTFPRQLADSPAHALNAYPGTNGVATYQEGLLVGYRWFDTKQVEPLFPFGHGLSYTQFEYADLKLNATQGLNELQVTAEFELSNTGAREGAEVVQVYVQDLESSLPRPLKELKGFSKVILKAGEMQAVSLTLDPRAFAFYDPEQQEWVAEAGDFKILVGSSSRDIRLEGTFKLEQTIHVP